MALCYWSAEHCDAEFLAATVKDPTLQHAHTISTNLINDMIYPLQIDMRIIKCHSMYRK